MHMLSAAGRRTTLLMLVAALGVWAMALWALGSTVGTIPGKNLSFVQALWENVRAGLGVSQALPALLLVVVIVATPVVIWGLLADYAAVYRVCDDGLEYETLGAHVRYPWSSITAIEEEPHGQIARLHVQPDPADQMLNPLLRLLHRQTMRRNTLRIPAEIERRDELLGALALHTGLPVNHHDTSIATGDIHDQPSQPSGADSSA